MKLIDILGGNGGSHWPDAIFSEISGYCLLDKGSNFGMGGKLGLWSYTIFINLGKPAEQVALIPSLVN